MKFVQIHKNGFLAIFILRIRDTIANYTCRAYRQSEVLEKLLEKKKIYYHIIMSCVHVIIFFLAHINHLYLSFHINTASQTSNTQLNKHKNFLSHTRADKENLFANRKCIASIIGVKKIAVADMKQETNSLFYLSLLGLYGHFLL